MQERKKILVTGAAHRIGAEFVKALALDGWHVVLHYNNRHDEAANLCTELTDKGHVVDAISADLSQPDAVDKLMEAATESGPLQALINNASLFSYDCAESFSADLINHHMTVNLSAPALLNNTLDIKKPEE